MLREFAFTPHVFAHQTNECEADWIECLRSIGRNLRPSSDTPIRIIISDLYSDGSASGWETVSRELADGIPRGNPARDLAMALLGRMKTLAVAREPVGGWPGEDEIAWIAEASLSFTSMPFDRLVATVPATSEEMVRASQLRDVLNDAFWDGSGPILTPRGSSEEQARLIAGMACHADFVDIVLPYGNEQEFGCDIVRSVDRLPRRARPRHVRVHTREVENSASRGLYLSSECNVDPASTQLTWCFWPGKALRERVVIAGRISRSGGSLVRGARWGLYMGHVPWDGVTDDCPPSQWSVMPLPVIRQHLNMLTDATSLSQAVIVGEPC